MKTFTFSQILPMNKLLQNRHTPFWLITFSIIMVLTLSVLIQDGMFMDAMLYTSVAHNLSHGIGTFWLPEFSRYNVGGLPSFYEQPPLVFGIQALFFKLLGDSMYVERFYTFLTLLVAAILIVILWKSIFSDNKDYRKIAWLPLFLWIIVPVGFWSYQHNMHENTMTIFILLSILFAYKAFTRQKHSFLFMILSGIMVFAATLSKGFPGFSPIVAPFLYWLTTRKFSFKKALLYSVIITVTSLIIYGILFLFPESKKGLSMYLVERFWHRINQQPTVDNRFWILWRLFTELLPSILFVLLFMLIAKIKKIPFQIPGLFKEGLFFILLGLSGSAPLMLTLVQKGFYFVPSLPFFGIGLAILIVPVISTFTMDINIHSKKFKLFTVLSIILFISSIGYVMAQKNNTSRDKILLHDVYLIGKEVPAHTLVSIPFEMWEDEWSLQCYLMRYYYISLDPEYSEWQQYFIINNALSLDVPEGYKKVNINTIQYDLYVREE